MDEMKGLAAVILAGGLQTRFRSVSDNIPKAMAPVGVAGDPNLVLLVEYLLKKGIKKVLIVAGFLAPIIQDRFESWSKRGVEVIVDPEGQRLETGGAMKMAVAHLLKEKDAYVQNILYWNPDTLVSVDPVKLYKHFKNINFPSSIVLTTDRSAPNFGAVKIFFHEGVAYINSFDEGKEPAEANIQTVGLAHGGVGIINMSTLVNIIFASELETKTTFCMWKEILPEVIKGGSTAFITSGPFLEWGVSERYRQLLKHPEWIEAAYAL